MIQAKEWFTWRTHACCWCPVFSPFC